MYNKKIGDYPPFLGIDQSLGRPALPGIITQLIIRGYLAAVLLIGYLSVILISTAISGAPPLPQFPPEGYVVERDMALLRWNKGTREGQVDLQISIDDPDFEKDVQTVKKVRTSHSLRNLKNGSTYYWRLVQNESASPVASFKVSKHNVKL